MLISNNNNFIYYFIIKYLINICPNMIAKIIYNKNTKHVYIYVFKKHINSFFFFINRHFNTLYKSINDFTVSDYPEYNNRFNLIYIINSILYNHNCIIKSWTNEVDAVDSISNIYAGANWPEREVWDMFGIQFNNHPDLRRILTDYGFLGFPLRKDFPLSGYIELRYYDKFKKIIYSPIKLIQEYRKYELKSPWNFFDLNFK